MKVTIAVIKLVLRTNKVLADGTHPIMLRVSFNGMKERSTGYSCSVKYWDKKNECVKKGFPNFAQVNYELKKQKDEAIAKRDKYIASDEVYTPAMILAKEEVRNAVTNDLNGLIERYIADKGLDRSTNIMWRTTRKLLIDYAGRSILVNEIDEAFCRKFSKWLEANGRKNSSIRAYMGKVVALLHYAVKLGLINQYPLNGWKYHRDYREGKNELYIHSRSMDIMIEMFLNEMIIRDGNLWHYKEGAVEKLMNIHSELYALYLYVLGFYFKGLAPVDISQLKKSDIKAVQIKDKSCYAIDGHRFKTGMAYKIRLEQNTILSQVLINTMLMFNDGDYFLPTLKNFSGANVNKKVNDVYSYHSEHLVEWFQKINEEIVRINVENGDNIPLIDLECRFYSYRHSFIMAEIQKPNVNLLRLATVTGKALTSLHQYLTYLNDEDLV